MGSNLIVATVIWAIYSSEQEEVGRHAADGGAARTFDLRNARDGVNWGGRRGVCVCVMVQVATANPAFV